jgi:hypothetical protein
MPPNVATNSSAWGAPNTGFATDIRRRKLPSHIAGPPVPAHRVTFLNRYIEAVVVRWSQGQGVADRFPSKRDLYRYLRGVLGAKVQQLFRSARPANILIKLDLPEPFAPMRRLIRLKPRSSEAILLKPLTAIESNAPEAAIA